MCLFLYPYNSDRKIQMENDNGAQTETYQLREGIFTCVAKGESRSSSAVTPSVCPSVSKSCHRHSSETTDSIFMKLGM